MLLLVWVPFGFVSLKAVVRECREELGLHLDNEDYTVLGRVKDRVVPRGTSTLCVSCIVFYQHNASGGPDHDAPYGANLQASEVAACGWSPLCTLVGDGFVEPLQWEGWSQQFTSVRLPLTQMAIAAARDGGSVGTPAEVENKFRLWGLTLSMVNDWLITCKLRTSRIDLFPDDGIVRPGDKANASSL